MSLQKEEKRQILITKAAHTQAKIDAISEGITLQAYLTSLVLSANDVKKQLADYNEIMDMIATGEIIKNAPIPFTNE